MRIILQQDITIKPQEKKIIEHLAKVVEFKKYYKPYDKKNLDFTQELKNDVNTLPLEDTIQNNTKGSINAQEKMLFGKSKYYQNTLGDVQQQSQISQAIPDISQQQKFRVYDSFFRFNAPVSEQPETKMSKRRRQQKIQSIMQSTINSPEKQNNIGPSFISIEDPSAYHQSHKNLSPQRTMQKSQSSFLPQIPQSVQNILKIGYENPYAYRKQKPLLEMYDNNIKKQNLNMKLQKLGKAQREYQSTQLRKKLQQSKDQHRLNTNDSNENYVGTDNEENQPLSGSQSSKRKIPPKRRQDQEETEKLNYLFQKYSSENIQKYLATLNKMPFKEVIEQIESDLSVSAQLLISFQDNTYIINQIEEIHTELGSLIHKKKKEKELFDKISNEEKKEQSLFEKARSFNPKFVDEQLHKHFEKQTHNAISQLSSMNTGIKEILDHYQDLKKYYKAFEKELEEEPNQ
ncbi:UNKNOWN [Stylonychia lemnae]|uniref:Uncharacterized protein n=1 Tax=Stylonychia lemnae TaxID=5949 RepID=A0A078AX48_STYLE|nr:UNKNOWN [Stylonychia lemnae]|eukprot:CDW86636.1 UNKNOWN [Stylonychia lemnae]